MSAIGSLLGAIGVGTSGSVDSSGSVYTWSQQNKDFIKAQFKYKLLLNQKLASGEIDQAYYDSHAWLTTETLTPPYQGWWDEFTRAINEEDLNWLSQQVGESVDSLIEYMGSALQATAGAVGRTLGTAASSTSRGLITGLVGSLNVYGWLTIAGLGVAVYFGWKKGVIQRAFKIAI